MTTHMQQHPSTFTALSSPGLLLWMPLDEVRQAWANFGAEALSCHALLATSSAFAALTWETSALQHHRMAYHAQQGGFPQEAAAHWLDQVVLDLSEAVRNWQCVQLCLERLVASSSDTAQAHTEPVRPVRAGSCPAPAPAAPHRAGAARRGLRWWTGTSYSRSTRAGGGVSHGRSLGREAPHRPSATNQATEACPLKHTGYPAGCAMPLLRPHLAGDWPGRRKALHDLWGARRLSRVCCQPTVRQRIPCVLHSAYAIA